MRNASVKVLLVEGQADKHFAIAFLKELGFTKENVFVREKGGYQTLREELPANFKESELERVGIIVDADDDPTSRWRSLRQRLEQIGYLDVPEDPVAGGFNTTADLLPELGVWLMPNNTGPGKVEHLFAAAIAPGDTLLLLSRNALAEVSVDTPGRFAEKDRIKAEVYTWIAWGDEPDLPLGAAATHHHLVGSSASREFRDWLHRTFAAT